MIDLGIYDSKTGSEAGRWLTPIGLDGQPIGLKIKVLGPDSKKYARLSNEVQQKLYQKLADAQNGIDAKDEGETTQERENAFYAKLTLGWEPLDINNPITWGGESFSYSEENAVKLYECNYLIRNQVKAFVEARKNFLPLAPEGLPKQ